MNICRNTHQYIIHSAFTPLRRHAIGRAFVGKHGCFYPFWAIFQVLWCIAGPQELLFWVMKTKTNGIALFLGALAVTAKLGDAAPKVSVVTRARPAGLLNEGNYCFANTIIQNLFHLPTIMEAAIVDGGNDFSVEERFITAAAFARLLATSNEGVRLSRDFIPTFERSVQRHELALEPGNPDDAEAFYAWMMNYALPKRAQEQAKTQMGLTKFFRGIAYRIDVEEEWVARVHLSGEGEQPLEELLAGLQAQPIQGVSIGRTGNFEIDQRLGEAGVVFDQPVNVVDETYAVYESGPILPVFVVKDWGRNGGIRLQYSERMNVLGTEYVLNGLVLHSPGHYYGKVRQLGGSTWWTLDDASVSPTDLADVLRQGERVAMLFYVQANLHQSWVRSQGIFNVRIPKFVQEHNRRLQGRRKAFRERRVSCRRSFYVNKESNANYSNSPRILAPRRKGRPAQAHPAWDRRSEQVSLSLLLAESCSD